MTRAVTVKQDPENEIGAEIIAKSIVDIADAMKKINATRLSRRALVILISSNSKLPMSKVELVLNNLDALADIYLKKKA